MEPQWRKLIFQYKEHVNWSYRMGGIIPSWNGYVDNINSVTRASQMGPMWLHAEQVSGMPMYATIWNNNPPASSFPSCIAVKCATAQSLEMGERMLRKLRESCHLNGKDISDKRVILEEAEALALTTSEFDLNKFLNDFKSESGQDYFREDWDETRKRGVTRFPTLFFSMPEIGTIQLSGSQSLHNMKRALFQLNPKLQAIEPNASVPEYKTYWGSWIEREELEFTSESIAQV
ncbi:DsbA family protein [Chryseotalea sanaruensis]|uniref:DsbA family protein n=2 Tax=Chryseotalea sanaruensis TaxID=2482724 RepID=A0A401U6M1_9BACT|nr:DsbA family protein [Chryseotalea sanaruensis]